MRRHLHPRFSTSYNHEFDLRESFLQPNNLVNLCLNHTVVSFSSLPTPGWLTFAPTSTTSGSLPAITSPYTLSLSLFFDRISRKAFTCCALLGNLSSIPFNGQFLYWTTVFQESQDLPKAFEPKVTWSATASIHCQSVILILTRYSNVIPLMTVPFSNKF